MPTDSYDVVPSHPMARALAANSNASTPLLPLLPVQGDPGVNASGTRAAGYWEAGQGGMFASAGVFLMPFGAGNKGDQFLLRIWGWRKQLNEADPLTGWYPLLLAELACVLGDIPGAVQPPSEQVTSQEKFCDTIAVTRGTAGVANPAPGGDLISYASVGLAGCQRFQFEFEQVDDVAMNCLWARV